MDTITYRTKILPIGAHAKCTTIVARCPDIETFINDCMNTISILTVCHLVGALMACTLWLGNSAYLFLSVSFIQMLKALMPASVYLHGLVYGVEAGFNQKRFMAILVISGGVLLASFGEVQFRYVFRSDRTRSDATSFDSIPNTLYCIVVSLEHATSLRLYRRRVTAY